MRELDWLDITLLGLLAFALGGVLVLFESCSVPPVNYPRGPLSDQILRPLPSHTGLVNTACTHDPKTGVCTYDRVEYDLNDEPTRQRLRDAGFVCDLNGQDYRIALNTAGLIRETYDSHCVLFFCSAKTARTVDYIPITAYQKLIDLKTECKSIFVYGRY